LKHSAANAVSGDSPAVRRNLNVGEAASYIGIKKPTLRKWLHLKKGPSAIKIGAAVRYCQSDLDAWLQSQPRVGGTVEGE
jgi:excisionase family DNA binding protein